MISMEGWLFISMVGTLFLWGAVIAVLGMFSHHGRPDPNPNRRQGEYLSDERLESWGRDLWRTP